MKKLCKREKWKKVEKIKKLFLQTLEKKCILVFAVTLIAVKREVAVIR